MSSPVALLIPAAGLGTRMGGQRKAFLELAGKPVLFHTLDRFARLRGRIRQTLIIVHPDDVDAVRREWGAVLVETYAVSEIVPGGARRQDSVLAGLARVDASCEIVAIQDAVRPFVPPSAIAACFDAAEDMGAALVATPMKPTVKQVADGRVLATVGRGNLWCAQTPQVFNRELILDAYAAAERDGLDVTDDAQVVEHFGHPVAVVPGSDLNIKLTTPEDLTLAEAIVANGLIPE